MSMIRAQEYFAPLRSRHISLQQWERGLLFESWGRRGGRADRRKSGDLNSYMASSDSEDQSEVRPMKKVIARSISFSAFGIDSGSEMKGNVFKRGLSFSRSLAPTGEIMPEVSDHGQDCVARLSNTDHPPTSRTTTSTGALLSRSLESSRELEHIGSDLEVEISGGSSSRSECVSDCDRPVDRQSRPWPKKFFSGGLLFSKSDKNFFSGTLPLTNPFGRNSNGSQIWDTKKSFFARVLSFSRVLDPRGEISSDVGDIRTPLYMGTEIQEPKNFLGRDLSFSRSLDPRGELPLDSDVCDLDMSSLPKNTEIQECENSFRRDLSFSRSLDRNLSFSRSLDPNVNGDSLSDTSEASGNSGFSTSELKAPELSWSKKFISRSGLFFSRSLDPRRFRESPSKIFYRTGRLSNLEKDPKDMRSRKVFGRGFSLSFSRFMEPNSNSSSVKSGTANRQEKVGKEFQFKNFFTRGLGLFSSNSRTFDTRDRAASNCTASRSSDNTRRSHSKKFLSKGWSASRSRTTSSSSAQLPISVTNSINPSTTVINPCSRSKAGSNSIMTPRGSRMLKYFWSKRGQNTAVTSKSGLGSDKTNRLVLLEKVPAADDQQDSDDLTVYVGERGGSLTKYVLTRQILRHHLFQVLLKCSQDELGSDYDYNSGVPIICDPALFLQVARVVGGNFSSEDQLCRFAYVAKPTVEEVLQCTLQLIKTQANHKKSAAVND